LSETSVSQTYATPRDPTSAPTMYFAAIVAAQHRNRIHTVKSSELLSQFSST
jgi:hypothetical protein